MCALTHVYVQNIIYIKRYKQFPRKVLIGLTRQEQQDC